LEAKGQIHNVEWLGQVNMKSKWVMVRKEMATSFFKILFQHLAGVKGIICGTSDSHIPGKLDISKK
jgi:hypothetical protein